MQPVVYRPLQASPTFWGFIGVLAMMVAVGLLAAYHMEHEGHVVTGMTNQIVWGLPHIFAITLILIASGILNIASLSTVFKRSEYKVLGRLSGLFAITFLVAGLIILVLDLGRPERLIVAMTSYNPKSIFTWNILLYNGFMLVVAVYLWFMMERQMQRFSVYAGYFAFFWRLILTTGTGSIFGFLVARSGYDTALLAPLFIALSLMLGTAVFNLFLIGTYRFTQRPLGDAMVQRLKNLLGLFIGAVFYFVMVYHLTNLYVTGQHAVEYFFLINGGIYPMLFWGWYLVIGTLLPTLLLFHPSWGQNERVIVVASLLALIGGVVQLYVIIIGGQAFPLEIFPGKEVIASGFMDDAVMHHYAPSIWELMLGMGGVALAVMMSVVAMMVLEFAPASLADENLAKAK